MFPIIEDRAKTCNRAFKLFAEIVRTEKIAMAKDMYAKIKIKEEPFANLKT